MTGTHTFTVIATAAAVATTVAFAGGCTANVASEGPSRIECAAPPAPSSVVPFTVTIRRVDGTVRAGRELRTKATLTNVTSTAVHLNLNASAMLDGVLTDDDGRVLSPTRDQVVNAGGKVSHDAEFGSASSLAPIQPGTSVTMPVMVRLDRCDALANTPARAGSYRLRLLLSYQLRPRQPSITVLSKAVTPLKVS